MQVFKSTTNEIILALKWDLLRSQSTAVVHAEITSKSVCRNVVPALLAVELSEQEITNL